jgi:hypothetical protein
MKKLPSQFKGVLALAATFVAGSLESTASETASVAFDSKLIAKNVEDSLGAPARFNWESVKVNSIQVTGGNAKADLIKQGDTVTAHIRGDKVFAVTGTGVGDRDSKLHVSMELVGLDAKVSLVERQAEVEASIRVVNHENCRMWTRVKNQRTSPFTRITFRVTAIPRPLDVQLKVRARVTIRSDGTVVLVPLSWKPANPDDKIDVKISGQNLPDGWATIKPLDVETFRVDMDIPFDAGDRTIKNPLRDVLGKAMGREFILGKLPQ